ncbi:hypothetical protein MS3_00000226 [Schistosoma haematobium]|uniref:Uncharacterized protein n=1 Tax=Schistosoma haematobium TaxID=6185 RepID=A0A922LH35_SCHHA|nr:hypothetical protein MS3_00000226 [Schistosoma haematobium]KAH9584465.1 hypothetical protein MS3_00000226 [Schistosoma haematobium]
MLIFLMIHHSLMTFLINLRKIFQKNQVILNVICPYNAFVSHGKVVQCESPVLNELDFDYNSNDFISNIVYPYHEVTSNVYSSQCEKYILNEVTSFITWGYEDPKLFRGGG